MALVKKERSALIFEIAEKSLEAGQSAKELSREQNQSRSSVTEARLILMFGTEEQIRLAREGEISLYKMSHLVRERMPFELRVQHRHKALVGSYTQTRREINLADAATWARLGPSVTALTELPSPKEMVAFVRAKRQRKLVIEKHLERATLWLMEFEHEWKQFHGRTTQGTDDA